MLFPNGKSKVDMMKIVPATTTMVAGANDRTAVVSLSATHYLGTDANLGPTR
jgi:hypothetical protein